MKVIYTPVKYALVKYASLFIDMPQLNRKGRFNPDEMAFGFHWAGGVKISRGKQGKKNLKKHLGREG